MFNKKETNTGNYNTGHRNTGNRNTGNRNTGDYNTGSYNTGSYNTGYYNTGDRNTGHRNTGHRNTGNRNTGNRNTGDCNTGHFNTGNSNTGFFNTNEPNVRLFNKETNLKKSEIDIPYINLKITEWVNESDMTDQQKKDDKDFHIKGGTLISRTYKEAWQLYWSEAASEEDKKRFLNLPNFDADIFEEITGINVNKSNSCNGKVVEIDGKKYKLTEVE